MIIAALAAAASAVAPVAIHGASPTGLRIAWQQVIASPGDDWINDIVPLGGQRFGLTGFVERSDGPKADWRALFASVTANGRILGREHYGAGSGIDAFWTGAKRAGPDGKRWIGGFTSRIGFGGIDAWAARVDANGKLVDERTFGGGGYDRFTSMADAGDGQLFVGHSEPEGVERRRLLAVRMSDDGKVLWQRIIDADPDALAALYVEPAGDGGFIVSGGLGHGEDNDIFILKLDAGGRELWRRTVGTAGASDINHGLMVRADGTIIVTGYVKSWGSRDNDILAATFSPEGTLLKKALLGGVGDDRPILVKPGSNGSAWIVGYTRSATASGDWDMIIARLDGSGEFMPGVATVGTSADDNGTAIAALPDGGALAAGYSKGLGSLGEDAFVVRLSPADWTRANPAFTTRVAP
jgi:hypothetical protein